MRPAPPLGGRPEYIAGELVAELLIDDLLAVGEGAVRQPHTARLQPTPEVGPHRLGLGKVLRVNDTPVAEVERRGVDGVPEDGELAVERASEPLLRRGERVRLEQ